MALPDPHDAEPLPTATTPKAEPTPPKAEPMPPMGVELVACLSGAIAAAIVVAPTLASSMRASTPNLLPAVGPLGQGVAVASGLVAMNVLLGLAVVAVHRIAGGVDVVFDRRSPTRASLTEIVRASIRPGLWRLTLIVGLVLAGPFVGWAAFGAGTRVVEDGLGGLLAPPLPAEALARLPGAIILIAFLGFLRLEAWCQARPSWPWTIALTAAAVIVGIWLPHVKLFSFVAIGLDPCVFALVRDLVIRLEPGSGEG